jgi:hypothetical protein
MIEDALGDAQEVNRFRCGELLFDKEIQHGANKCREFLIGQWIT